MKKFFTLVFCVLATISAKAQIEILNQGKAAADGSTIEVFAHETNMGDDDNPYYTVEFGKDLFVSNKGTHPAEVTLTVTKTNADDDFSWCIGGSCKPFLDMSLTQTIKMEGNTKEDLQLHPESFNWEIGKEKSVVAKLEVSANGKTLNFSIHFIYKPLPTGIEAQQKDQISVANKQLSYNFSNSAARSLNIYGVSGRLVKSAKLAQNGTVGLNDLQHGVYIYEVLANGKRTATHKFVIR